MKLVSKINVLNKHSIAITLCCLLLTTNLRAQYNQLWIPDTLSGTQFNLTLQDTFKQFLPGQQTITEGINGNWWGPTLFFNKGDTVHINVINQLQDSSTIHWHGMHLPAVMDGGPHQPIPSMTIWSPYYKVMNNAATYWYHPHLHMMTEEQVIRGLGGLIIVRDSVESMLNLPRTYGIDDIPLVLSDRRFDTTFANQNQLSMEHLGDTMMVNGTLFPEYNVPAQVVRFRILNGAMERAYKFGFSDSTAFSVISTDGGLLNTPISINTKRFIISPGERVEILVNLNGRQGQSLDLMAFNSTLPPDYPGASAGIGPQFNLLGGRDFLILHLTIGAQTLNPCVTIPGSLTTNTFWSAASATNTRHIVFSDPPDSLCDPNHFGCGWFDSTFFDINTINYYINRNAIEIWELENKSGYFSHPFHMHDVQFYILDRNGSLPPTYERGWKDVVMVRKNTTVRVIAKFQDYADSLNPYMYHCHTLFHEDAGMMGQFVVVDPSIGISEEVNGIKKLMNIFPNPANDEVNVSLGIDYLSIKNNILIQNLMGVTLFELNNVPIEIKIKTTNIPNGIYFIKSFNETNSITKKLIIQH